MLRAVRKRFLKIVVLAAIVGSIYGIDRLHDHMTDGFSVSAIGFDYRDDSDWKVPEGDEATQDLVNQILKQSFTYLATGTQSFVFVSEDGQYILKILKMHRLHIPWSINSLLRVPFFDAFAKRTITRRLTKKFNVFSGAKLAYEKLPERAGILYLHLAPSEHLPNAIRLVDKLKLSHKVNPNRMAFYIQQKGIPLGPALIGYRAHGRIDEAKLIIRKIFDYLRVRMSLGIWDRDPNYEGNLGILGDQIGNIDVGNICIEECRERQNAHLVQFRAWLLSNFPQVVPDYDLELSKTTSAES